MVALNLVMDWFMLFMCNNMCLVVMMHYWSSLMHNSSLMVHCNNRFMSVFLISHEFLKEGLGHLDVFDVMRCCRLVNVPHIWLSEPVLASWHLDEARLLNVVRLFVILWCGCRVNWLLDIVRLWRIHGWLTIVCLMWSDILVWHVDVAVF